MTIPPKYAKITLNVKKLWELPKGHSIDRSGSGQHDSRPNRQRTRRDANKSAIKDFGG